MMTYWAVLIRQKLASHYPHIKPFNFIADYYRSNYGGQHLHLSKRHLCVEVRHAAHIIVLYDDLAGTYIQKSRYCNPTDWVVSPGIPGILKLL